MQTKLHRWASEDSARRFGDLFNLVYDPAFLVDAWERVRGNDGARTAGVDGLTVAQVETRVGVGVFLGQIRDLLKSGEYRPSPVRQVKIPKGGGKLRTLGDPDGPRIRRGRVDRVRFRNRSSRSPIRSTRWPVSGCGCCSSAATRPAGWRCAVRAARWAL